MEGIGFVSLSYRMVEDGTTVMASAANGLKLAHSARATTDAFF